MPMSVDRVVGRSPSAVFRPMDQGGVLLHLDSGAYHEVNQIACIIWEELESPMTVHDLAERVRRRIGNAPDSLDEDVEEFISELLARNLAIADQPDGF